MLAFRSLLFLLATSLDTERFELGGGIAHGLETGDRRPRFRGTVPANHETHPYGKFVGTVAIGDDRPDLALRSLPRRIGGFRIRELQRLAEKEQRAAEVIARRSIVRNRFQPPDCRTQDVHAAAIVAGGQKRSVLALDT